VICTAVVDYYGLDPSALLRRHDPHLARAVAAWLCRRHTEAPLRELTVRLGLSRATSVPNLTRRVEARLEKSPRLKREMAAIMGLVRAQTDAGSPPCGPSGRTHAAAQAAGRKTKKKG
jgi:chromosomal replication initiation ATPase DnaA